MPIASLSTFFTFNVIIIKLVIKFINLHIHNKGGMDMEENSNLHSINALKNMEVIDINSGAKIGFIKDIKIDYDNKKVLSIIMPGENKGWFSKTEDIEISWESIIKLGVDVIIVDCKELQFDMESM